MIHRGFCIITVFAVFLNCSILVATGKNREAVPSPEKLAAARAKIFTIFKNELTQTDPEARLELARKLISIAQNTYGEPATQYALLAEAGKIAVKTWNLDIALEATDLTIELFAVDDLKFKGKVLSRMGAAVKKSNQAEAVSKEFMALARTAMNRDNYEIATKAIKAAVRYAKKGNDRELIHVAKTRQNDILRFKLFYRRFLAAKTVLLDKPLDPAANLVCGRFICFIQKNWKKGLPMLMRGADKSLQNLASLELKQSNTTKKLINMGDGWNRAAKAESMPRIKRLLRERALGYYQRALNDLTGLTRMEIEKKADRLQRILDPSVKITADMDNTIKTPRGCTSGLLVLVQKTQQPWDGVTPLSLPGKSQYLLIKGRVIMPRNYSRARLRVRVTNELWGVGQAFIKLNGKTTVIRQDDGFAKIPRNKKMVKLHVRMQCFSHQDKIKWELAALEWSLDDGAWEPVPRNRLFTKKNKKHP